MIHTHLVCFGQGCSGKTKLHRPISLEKKVAQASALRQQTQTKPSARVKSTRRLVVLEFIKGLTCLHRPGVPQLKGRARVAAKRSECQGSENTFNKKFSTTLAITTVCVCCACCASFFKHSFTNYWEIEENINQCCSSSYANHISLAWHLSADAFAHGCTWIMLANLLTLHGCIAPCKASASKTPDA